MDSQEKNVDKVSGRRGHVRSGISHSRRMTRWQRIGTDSDQAKKFYDALCPYWQNDKIEIFGEMVLCCLPGPAGAFADNSGFPGYGNRVSVPHKP